jgi:rRNA maturation RNase YbeY
MPNILFQSYRIKFKLSQPQKHIQWLQNIAKQENAVIQHLLYVFCSDNYLLKINQQYLNHHTLTDIITFDYSIPHGKNIPKKLIGEIFISINRVNENAIKYNTTPQNELNRVIAHGVLHLCGYKDKTGSQQKIMREKEDFYLKQYPG